MGLPKGRTRNQAEPVRNYFKIKVKLLPTDEVFTLTQVYSDMKIKDLKAYLEFSTGIPAHIQRVCYLDEGELLDDTDVRSNDIVPGATLHMKVWPMWTSLIEAVAQNDIDMVMSLGVTNPSTYRSPNSDYMKKRAKNAWLEERAAVALQLAASRGLEKMCLKLIESGADVNATTEHGRSALHIASAQGHGHIVDLLLEKGADIDREDDSGETALSLADRFGFKSCGRHLFLFHWQQRAKKVTPTRNIPLMAHQKTDSLYPVWKRGQKAQVYVAHLESNGEFEGTRLGAPKRSLHPSIRHKMERDRFFATTVQADAGSCHESEEGDYFPDGTEEARELPQMETTSKSDKYLKKSRPLQKPETHKEWLQKIKDEEEKVREAKRKLREEKKQKRLEEEEKRKEENEKLGYERWLQQRQQEKADRLSRAHTATTRSQRGYDDDDDDDGEVKEHPAGALRLYLRSLGCSKAGVSYEQWLNDKEREVYGLPLAHDRAKVHKV